MNMEYLFIYLSFWLICATDFYILILFYVLHFYWIYLLILANIFFLVESLKGFYIYVLCRAGHWVHTSDHCNTFLQWKLLSYVEAVGLFKEKAAGTLCSAGNWGPWWYLVWLTLSVLTPLFPSQLQTPQLSTSPQKSYECGYSPFFAPLYCCLLGVSQGHLPSWTAVWLFFYWPRDKGWYLLLCHFGDITPRWFFMMLSLLCL